MLIWGTKNEVYLIRSQSPKVGVEKKRYRDGAKISYSELPGSQV